MNSGAGTQNRLSSSATHDRAYVLHSVPYKETSLIVELFTQQHGRLPVIAKGAKRKHSQLRGVLVHFQPLEVRFSGKSEVKTLQNAEWEGGMLAPEGRSLFAAYYLNEILILGLKRDDPHPDLFVLYQDTLARLSRGEDMNLVIRRFELQLLADLGFGLDFTSDREGRPLKSVGLYKLDPESGWFEAQSYVGQTVKGQMLIELGQGLMTLETAQALKGLTRQMLSVHVAPNGLLSRTWMEQLVKND
ncbi:MAG: DNA repair protein RecO [Limnobacter sp.]|nr:DNA repair protein RecO [Limnobacter sp.]